MISRLLNSLLKRNSIFPRLIRSQRRNLKTASEDERSKRPIKYSSSKAAKWKAVYSSSGEDYFTTPAIQPFAIMMSLTAFMVYFCILREENDLDEWLKNLEHEVPLQIQEVELRNKIAEAKRTHTDACAYEQRLQNITDIRKKINVLDQKENPVA